MKYSLRNNERATRMKGEFTSLRKAHVMSCNRHFIFTEAVMRENKLVDLSIDFSILNIHVSAFCARTVEILRRTLDADCLRSAADYK